MNQKQYIITYKQRANTKQLTGFLFRIFMQQIKWDRTEHPLLEDVAPAPELHIHYANMINIVAAEVKYTNIIMFAFNQFPSLFILNVQEHNRTEIKFRLWNF